MEIKVLEKILGANDTLAERNREFFDEKGVFVLNLMGAPGAGKTKIIERTVKTLGDEWQIGVIEGDIESTLDAERLSKLGIPVTQINTGPFGGACHLEAGWIMDAALRLPLDGLDLIFVENIGNLVCPAEFDIGANKNVVILSLPEGDDKPIKYPLVFRISHLLLINKIDLCGVLNFNVESLLANVQRVNPELQCFTLSAITGEGFDAWINWLKAFPIKH